MATSETNGRSGFLHLEEEQFYKPMDIVGSGTLNDFSYRFRLRGKTDYDDWNSQHEYHLDSFQGDIKNANQHLRVGETYAHYSKYSLTHSVKGAIYSYTSGQEAGSQFSVIYGFNCSDWDSFWGKKTSRRQVQGVRYKQTLSPGFWLAANMVQAKDRFTTTSEARQMASVISLDWHYQLLHNLVFHGETAFSDVTEAAASHAETSGRNGTAQLIHLQLTRPTADYELEYERIDSDFVSLVADTTADREKLNSSVTVRANALTEYTIGLLWYHDNLSHHLAYRTDHYQPRLAIMRKQMFNRTHARLDASYSFKHSKNPQTNRHHHYVTVGYLDHFGPIVSRSNFNIIFYDNSQATNGGEYTYNTTVSSHLVAADRIHLKPELRLGGWMISDELNDAEKQVWEYSLGLGISIPRKNIETFLRIGQNRLIDKNDEDIAKLMASLSLNYQLKKPSPYTTELYFKGHLNDYSYTTASNNYAEISISSGLHITF